MKKRMIRRMTAVCSAFMMMQTGMPSAVKAADESYLIRDKWGYCQTANFAESEHFVIFYGNNDTTGQVNEAFLKRNLEDYETLWKCYGEYLGMTDMNVDIYGKSTQKYKTNVYLTYTGLPQYPDGWAFMSAEDGYGIEIISPEAMLDELTIAHEFGHVVTMQQKAWVDQEITGAWWEPLANWFREMYLDSSYYSGTTKTCWFEPYIRNMSLTLPHGRNYYEVWPFLMYLSKNPDQIDGLGVQFVKRMISEAKPKEYPFDTIVRLTGTDAQTIFGNYAKRMATFDFAQKEAYQAEFRKLLQNSPYFWNLFYTVPSDIGNGWLLSPQEEAPMQGGINIIPLTLTGDTVSVDFRGVSDDENADWQACIVTIDAAGKETYSALFGNGDTMQISAKNAVAAYLTVSAMPKALNPVNAFHKERDSAYRTGNERRRYPYEIRLTGAAVQQSGGYQKGRGHSHANGGGWVDNTASVADSVYVGKDAMVLGSAQISGNARIENHAVVAGTAVVKDQAVISGHAVVDGGGWVYLNGWKTGNVEVSGNAVITDSAVAAIGATISGDAKICQKAFVTEAATVTDHAVIKGMSYLTGDAVYSGQVITDGDYANTVSKDTGIGFGWLDENGWYEISDGYSAFYDFSDETAYWAKDQSSATNALQIGAEWSAERTSAKGVINFDGSEAQIVLDDSVLLSRDLQISLAALWTGGVTNQELFRFGDQNAFMSFTPCNETGQAAFTITDGKTKETLTADSALTKGEWNRITIRIVNGTASLLINGTETDSKHISLTPVDIMSNAETDRAVIGKGFRGAVDYLQFCTAPAAEPKITYSGTEAAEETVIKGDVDANGAFEIADIVLLQKWLTDSQNTALKNWEAGDLMPDGALNAVDLTLIKRMMMQ